MTSNPSTEWQNVHIASPYDDSPDAEVATENEVSYVANTGQVTMPQPQRFNPNLPYADVALSFSGKDRDLLQIIQRAIDNGWAGWQAYVNDATTLGLEAEQIVKEMKRFNKSVKTILFDKDFARFLWPNEWENHLQAMVLVDDPLQYVKEHLSWN